MELRRGVSPRRRSHAGLPTFTDPRKSEEAMKTRVPLPHWTKSFACPLATCWLLIAAQVYAAEPAQTEGKVDSVTVYRGQALVTRVADLPGPAGLREVVITNLPDKV